MKVRQSTFEYACQAKRMSGTELVAFASLKSVLLHMHWNPLLLRMREGIVVQKSAAQIFTALVKSLDVKHMRPIAHRPKVGQKRITNQKASEIEIYTSKRHSVTAQPRVRFCARIVTFEYHETDPTIHAL